MNPFKNFSKIEEYIQTCLKQSGIPGMSVAIVQAGESIFCKGYGQANVELSVLATPDTVYEIASLTKTFTAFLTLLLVEEGVINLSKSITDYLSNSPATWQPVTIRHILCHQSGIKSYTSIEQYWKTTRLDVTREEILALVLHLSLQFLPGERSFYDNTGYFLLGIILETITGKTYQELLQEKILTPLSMTATRPNDPYAIIPQRAAGYTYRHNTLCNKEYYSSAGTYSAGILLSNVVDLIKWEQALYQQKLLTAASYEQMWMPQKSTSGNENQMGYQVGLGWFLPHYPGRRVATHNGSIKGFASNMTRFIDDRITVIVLANLDTIERPDAIALEIAKYLIPELAQENLMPPYQKR